MLIKCPECSTEYNIPDTKVGEKPKKMRCFKCKQVFTVARKGEDIPKRYEEFLGHESALPEEFSFLTEKKEEPVIEPTAQAEEPSVQVDERAVQFEEPEVETDEPAVQFEELVDQQSLDVAAPIGQPPILPQPIALQQANPIQIPGMYGGGAYSDWEIEAPLDLESYAVDARSGSQKTGKIIFFGAVLLAFFLLFVAYRNGWTLSLDSFGEQVSFAFSSEKLEVNAEEVKGLEVIVEERNLVTKKDQSTVLIVTGKVFNNKLVSRSHVILRWRIKDLTNEIRSQSKFPCGKVIDMNTLIESKKGEIEVLFKEGGTLFNCLISSDSFNVFQAVIEDIPPEYNESFTVEVEPVAAGVGG